MMNMQIPRQHLVARIGITSMENLLPTASFGAGDWPDDARSPLLKHTVAVNYITTHHNVPCTPRGLAAVYRGNCCPRFWQGPADQRLTTYEEIDSWVATPRFRLISARLKLGPLKPRPESGDHDVFEMLRGGAGHTR